MQFHSRDNTGRAGERLLEEFVDRNLNFVYRKTDHPDIGIDGEIEVLNDNRDSTGGLIKVQVKTTEEEISGTSYRVQFDEAHLDYFDSITVPPILAVVSMHSREIWWTPILSKDNYLGPRGGFGISIDVRHDKMSIESKPRLKLIGERSNGVIALYVLGEVNRRLQEMDDEEAGGEFDITSADAWASTLSWIRSRVSDARCLLSYERRKTDEIVQASRRLAMTLERVRQREKFFKRYEIEDILDDRRSDYGL